MLRYECFGFWLYLAIATGLTFLYSPVSFASDMSGNVDVSNMPTKKSLENHIKWTKIVISSNAGEKPVKIDETKYSFDSQNIGVVESLTVAWIWQLPDGVSGDDITHGLFPLVVKDVSGTVGFTFYDLGSIHKRFVKEVGRQTERNNFSTANGQFEIANDYYEKIRELNSTKWSAQVNSWNYTLYQTGFNKALKVGIRRIELSEKEKIRGWLKNSISLCVEQQSLKSRLSGALQSWSKFAKLAYSRVSDWPDTIPQDMTDEEVNRVFLNEGFRDWMIEDIVWLQDEIFKNESVRALVDGKPQLIGLVPNDSGMGTSLSKFAQAITDFTKEWK